MGGAYNSRIITDGLVLALDAANPKNYNLTEVEVLVVAGGGSGGVDNGGGGGAGGLIYNSNFAVTPGTQLTVTVGAGGAARAGSSDDGPGNNGGNSIFGSLTAYGGGGGSGWTNTTLPPGSSSYTGGSGAGQSASTGGANSLGAGTGNRVTGTNTVAAGQGNNGGTAVGAFAGGGGGAGGTGGNASNGAAGAGGLGFRSVISGSQVIYAAGGAGGWDVISGYVSTLPSTENGTVKKTTQTNEDAVPANTGHGGNGSNHNNVSSGAGGSGIAIVRYPGPQKAKGGTITSNNGYTIHTFTTSSTFTPLVATNNSAILGLSDLSGNGNFGTTENSPTYSSANGGALVFDGSNDYIALPHDALWKNIKNITYDLWFQTAAASTRQGLISSHENTGGSNQDAIEIEIQSNNTSFVGFRSTNGSFYMALYNTTLSTNTWYNLTGVLTDSSIIYYLNGTQVATSGWPGTNVINAPASTLLLAKYAGLHLNGRIGTFKAYNRALTAAEVSQNYNALRGRFGI